MDTQTTVLLVEDNHALNEINRRALELAGHRVLAALTLNQARAHLAAHSPDVILLDIVLPDGDGIDFCGEIRGTTDAHILFLTSKTDHVDRIRGLETGGDDYITKPYLLDEMLARVGAVIRRREMAGLHTTLTRGPLTLDATAMRAYLDGKDIELTPKQYALLYALVQNHGRPLRMETLYDMVWKQPLVDSGNALWTQMSRLKKKLEVNRHIALNASRIDGYTLEIIE